MEQTTQQTTEASNVIPIRKTLSEVASEKGIEKALDAAEERLQKAEAILRDVRENHELFMQGLEDAAKECLKNDLIRVTIPAAFRKKLTDYIAAREKARANALPSQK